MVKLHRFQGGVHPPQHKELSTRTPIAVAPLPPKLVVPLRQSVGQAARAIVGVGERVLKGQCLGEADGRLSAAVHAPSSGIVVDISEQRIAHPSGLPDLCVTIEVDGLEQWAPRQPMAREGQTRDAVRRHLRDMGVVGLGGAVFPSHVKLSAARDIPLQTLVINGAECEPYISCDDRLMRERADGIVAGVGWMDWLMQPQEILIAVEDNKPEAIAALRAAVAAAGVGYTVVAVPTIYPGGGAKQLIRVLTGKEVPSGVRSTELGVQCFNVATAYCVHRALDEGEPVLSRIVTLTGEVARPGNVEALLGTPAGFLLDHAGIAAGVERIIMGGPMMGFPLPGPEVGINKASNCLIAASERLFPAPRPALPCIRCGQCAEVCPAELQPQDLFWFAKSRQFDRARERALFDCIECGCCSYVCPSEIPLVDYYRYAKSEIRAAEREKQAADRARERHEFRLLRLQRDKEEKAARLAAKAAAKKAAAEAAPAGSEPAPAADDKQARIRAAMERAAAQRAAAAPRNTEAPAPAVAAQMAEQDRLAARLRQDVEAVDGKAESSAAVAPADKDGTPC